MKCMGSISLDQSVALICRFLMYGQQQSQNRFHSSTGTSCRVPVLYSLLCKTGKYYMVDDQIIAVGVNPVINVSFINATLTFSIQQQSQKKIFFLQVICFGIYICSKLNAILVNGTFLVSYLWTKLINVKYQTNLKAH